MPEFLKKFINQTKGLFSKLSKVQKLIIISVVIVIVGAIIFTIFSTSKPDRVLLYKNGLKKADFDRVKGKLDILKVDYKAEPDKGLISVDNDEIATKLRAQLGLEGVVKDVHGFELFDNPKFTTTDFERKVNLRRAITGNMKRHLEALDDIEKAEVTISFPETEPFYTREKEQNPLTAAVVITPSRDSDLRENKKKIKGIRDLIAKSVNGLKPENVIITDHTGTVLTDKLSESDDEAQIAKAKKQLKLTEDLRKRYINDVRRLLVRSLSKDRYEVTVNLSLDWSSQDKSKEEVLPVVLRKRDPNKSYDDSKVIPSVPRSRSVTKEKFRSPSFIPEGPVSTEPNVGPGSRELVDQNSNYERTQQIENNEFGKEFTQEKSAPYRVKKVTIAVVVDEPYFLKKDNKGKIDLVEGSVVPIYASENTKNPNEFKRYQADIRQFEDLLKSSIAYDTRNKEVSVKGLRFDRKKEFDQLSSDLVKEREMWDRILIGLFVFLAVVVSIIVFRLYMRARDRRRRAKEEQLAREQQAMREAALLAAEKEGLTLDIAPEDKARLEMQENAINLARERPEEVAQLVRTWLVED